MGKWHMDTASQEVHQTVAWNLDLNYTARWYSCKFNLFHWASQRRNLSVRDLKGSWGTYDHWGCNGAVLLWSEAHLLPCALKQDTSTNTATNTQQSSNAYWQLVTNALDKTEKKRNYWCLQHRPYKLQSELQMRKYGLHVTLRIRQMSFGEKHLVLK